MKLLFDQNVAPSLVGKLADLFPGSAHVFSLGLDSVSDERIWEHARQEGFAVVSKDADYNQLSILRGHPPKVVWLVVGNCTTQEIEQLFRRHAAELALFEVDAEKGTIVLG